MIKHKNILSVLLTVIFSFSLVLCQSTTAMAAPTIWDLYIENGGIDQTIYNSEQATMNKYSDSYTLKPTTSDTLPHGASDAYTNLTINPSSKSMSKWYVSGYGPYLDYATNNVGNAEETSIDWNNENNTYSNANYVYIGSNQADLAEAKSVAMMNYSSNTLLPVLINSNSTSLSSAVTGAVDNNNINNLVILGGGQRFSDLIGIGDKYNMVRIGGVNRNDTYNLLSAVENGNKSGFYNPTQPTTDSNGVVCDINDTANFKSQDIAYIQNYLNKGDFNNAVSYVLGISQGSTSNIQDFNYSALIGCKGKFLKVFYVNYKNNFSYGVYQYMGPTYFNPVPQPPQPTDSIKADVNAPSQVTVGDDCYITGTGESTDNTTVNKLTGQIAFDSMAGVNPINLDSQSTDFKDVTKAPKDINFNGSVWFSNTGTYRTYSIVTDNNGLTGMSQHKPIKVVAPVPNINFVKGGTEKKNRKVIIDASSSTGGSKRYGIDWSKAKWTVAASSGGQNTDNDIRIQTHTSTPKTNGTILYDPSQSINKPLDGQQILDFTFKKPGSYKITCTLTNTYNSGISNTGTIYLNIVDDLSPIPNFTPPPSFALRDPNDKDENGHALCTLKLTDDGSMASGSYSPDGDIIAKRLWISAFDANNDDSFNNEKAYIYDLDYPGILSYNPYWKYASCSYQNVGSLNINNINCGNLSSVQLKCAHVGNYDFKLMVQEEFGQDYIPQFVSPEDRMTAIKN